MTNIPLPPPNTDLLLAIVGSVIIIGFAAEALFLKYRIPESLGLMFIGVLLGPVAHVIPEAQIAVLEQLAPFFGAIALVVIVFGGSVQINFHSVLSGGARGLTLAFLDTLLSIAVITPVFYYLFHWPLLISALFGAMLGETTAAVVIPIAQRIGLSHLVFNTVTLEATFNSVTCIVAFYILYDSATSSFTGLLGVSRYVSGLVGIGIFLGAVTGLLWIAVLSKQPGNAHSYMATIGLLVGLYAITDVLGGSAILAVLVFSLILGNSAFLKKVSGMGQNFFVGDLAGSHQEITFFVRTFFYVYIGLLVKLTLTSALVGLALSALLLAPRWLSVRAISIGSQELRKEQTLITSLYPRGLTVSVLAGIVINGLQDKPGLQSYSQHIFDYSFMVIVFSVAISSVLLAHEYKRRTNENLYDLLKTLQKLYSPPPRNDN